jgi:hypothetical protein
VSRWRVGKPILIPVLKAGRPWQHYFGTGALICGLHYFSKELRDFPDERTPLKVITLIILTICVWRKDIARALRRPRRERIRVL